MYAWGSSKTFLKTFNPNTLEEKDMKVFEKDDYKYNDFYHHGSSLGKSSATQVGPYIWIQGLK